MAQRAGTSGVGGRRGRPVAAIRRAQFNVNLPVEMIEWVRARAAQTRRRLNTEIEELLREAANGELEFIYNSQPTSKPAIPGGITKFRLRKA